MVFLTADSLRNQFAVRPTDAEILAFDKDRCAAAENGKESTEIFCPRSLSLEGKAKYLEALGAYYRKQGFKAVVKKEYFEGQFGKEMSIPTLIEDWSV